jgi:hypothetical protein
LQYGIIAGGLTDGSIRLWDPSKILGTPATGEDSPAAARLSQLSTITALSKHTGPVGALEFAIAKPQALPRGRPAGNWVGGGGPKRGRTR